MVVVAQAAMPAAVLALGVEVFTAEVPALMEATLAVLSVLFALFILALQDNFQTPTLISEDSSHAFNSNRKRTADRKSCPS